MLKNPFTKIFSFFTDLKKGMQENAPLSLREALIESGYSKTAETADWEDDSFAVDKQIKVRGGVMDFEFMRSTASTKTMFGVTMVRNRNLVVVFFEDGTPAEVYRK